MILPTLCKVGIETTMADPEMTREYNMYTVLFKCNRCPCRFGVCNGSFVSTITQISGIFKIGP